MTAVTRRLLAEFLGTGLLVTVVVGSGIAAQSLSSDAGLELFENAVVTAAGLAVLILVFGPISGAHLNPIVSLADWLLGRRSGTGISTPELLPYLAAQIIGAIGGAVLADAMYAEPLVAWSHHHRSAPHLWLGEAVASAGLLLVVVALARAGKSSQSAWTVGGYIGAAYFFTSSTPLRIRRSASAVPSPTPLPGSRPPRYLASSPLSWSAPRSVSAC